jgi:hypothetical protein
VKQHVIEMLGGPGKLRFALQPAIALLLGVLHGWRDHQQGTPPFLMRVIRARGQRLAGVGEGLRAIAVPLTVALVASVAFQYIIRAHVHLSYAVLYAFLFVAVPYLAARGLTNRAMRGEAAKRRSLH